MHKLDFEVKKIRELLKNYEGNLDAAADAAAGKLAIESVKAYKSRTMMETTQDPSGTIITTHYLKGLFINEDVKWNLIRPKPKVYREIKDLRGEMIEKKMGIEEDKRIFPPKEIVRDFTEETPNSKGSKSESFCKAKIRFDSKLMSKSEAIDHLATIRVEANEDDQWASDLVGWLDKEKESKFFFVVGFEIVCEFDFKKYWCERFEEIKDDVKRQIGRASGRENSNEQEQTEDRKHGEVAELAAYAVEYVVEKLVFYDLRDSFKHMCEEIEKEKETGNNEKQEVPPAGKSKPLPENRILFYNPLKLKLTAKLEPSTNDVTQISLGDQIEATIRIETEAKLQPDFQIDKNFKVIIEDGYFEAEDEEITFVKKGEKPVTFQPDKNRTYGENKVYYVETPKKILLTPKIKKITAPTEEYMPEYPLTFVLKKSTGILATSEETVPKRDVRQLAKCKKNVAILPPIVTMKRTRKRLPRKGEQLDIEFDLECKGTSKKPLMIPLTIKGYFGKPPNPDFEVVGCEPEKNGSTETGYYKKEFKIKVEEKQKKTFTLLARRASFPGYYGIANFKLEVGNWKTISEWRENMIIFPNFVDTFIAGVTTLLGIAYLYRPDWFPFIADIPALNIANLEAIPAVVYLAYRALNWTKATTTKAASGGG